MQRDIADLLEDILEAADFITADTAGATFDAFVADRRARQLVNHNFLIIGEAVHRLSRRDPGAVEQISSHEQIISFRNVLIHGYDLVDYHTVWRAIHESFRCCATRWKRCSVKCERRLEQLGEHASTRIDEEPNYA